MKSFFAIFSFIIVLNCYAQEPVFKIRASDVFRDEYRETYVVFAQDDSKGGCYVGRSYKGGILSSAEGYYVERYDAGMKLVKSIDYPQENKTYQKYKLLLGVVSHADTFSFIEFFYNVKQKAYQCIAHSINFESAKYTDTTLFSIDRGELDDMGKIALGKLFYKGENHVDEKSAIAFLKTSENDAFAIMLNIRGRDKKYYKIYSFDNKLSKKIEHTAVKGLGKKEYTLSTIGVFNAGETVYLLTMGDYDDKRTNPADCQITEISAAGERSGSFVNELRAYENLKLIKKDNAIICAGFYIEPKSKWFDGVSFFKIDGAGLGLQQVKHTPFTEEIKKGKTGGWFSSRYNKALLFKNAVLTDDDSFILTGEEYYEVETQNTAGPGMVSAGGYVTYHFDNIICTKVDASGNVVWVKDVEKEQSSGDINDARLSYTPLYKNNILSLFINVSKDIKLNDAGNPRFRGNNNKSDLTVLNISSDGNLKYEKLVDDESSIGPYMTARGITVPGSIFFLGRKGAEKQMLEISY
ncbi:hypothetical protein ACLI09_01125 [Flavobacterium sp. RHBU_24]|uniref:hypothetical protein n=1 Tax=Flavobacterium sp. RHBU_24 TaxID=3391185 RepID=UPI0039850A3C